MIAAMTYYSVIAWVVTLVVVSLSTNTHAFEPPEHGGMEYNDKEQALINKLFGEEGRTKYNPLVRPVMNASDVISVNFSLQLSQVIYIDEKNQIMKSNVWLPMYWHDYQLKWNPKHFGGITRISVDSKYVWTPDVVLINNADGAYEVSYHSKVVLYAEGNTMYVPPAIYQSSCGIDVNHFPYDTQQCDMKFASWSFTRSELKFNWANASMTEAIMDDYLQSGTWDIMGSLAVIEDYYELGMWKTHVLYRFKIRRKTLFYVVNLIIPCVLISFVTPSVHILPPEACEKITLSVSILITLVVFIFLVSKILPPFVILPILYKYLLFTLIMNVLAVLLTVIVINRSNRTPRTHGMPMWVRKVFLNHLPRYLFMKRPQHDTRWQKKDTAPQTNRQLSGRDNVANRISTDFSAFKHSNCQLHSPIAQRKDYAETNMSVLDEDGLIPEEMIDAVKAVTFIAKHIELEEEFDTVVEDWKYVALVMDRFLFYVIFFTNLVGTMGIFLQASGLFNNDKKIA